MVFNPNDGEILHSLKGHKDSVYCLSYSRDGKRFASGGADKAVIIWTSNLDGIYRYNHLESIQALAYNPVTQQLASCTAVDIGLWSPEQKNVHKPKVSNRITCCSWTSDGQFLALGFFNGQVSIRDKNAEEKNKIDVTKGGEPVWCLQWKPGKNDQNETLAVGSFDQTLSFYHLSGKPASRPRKLGYDPLSLAYFPSGEFLVIAGTNSAATLYTRDGIKIGLLSERESWVWTARPSPKQNMVLLGCHDGTLAETQVVFSTVHGLYQERYAYRDLMTEVVVQNLTSEHKLRINCKDCVKKIAIYKDRLAVQLSDVIVVYELYYNDAKELDCRLKEKINENIECNLLVVTDNHLVLCLEKKLQLLNFQGVKVREWTLESIIRYIKVIGGKSKREGLLVGLKTGVVLEVFLDSPFPVQLIKHTSGVRCLDLSASRRKVAVVDENSTVTVYDVLTKELLFVEPNAKSVSWNTEMEDMLCYSGSNNLYIKAGSFPPHTQKLQGFVVGFKGSKIFCLQATSMITVDVPQSATLYRYLEQKQFDTAYKIACLGVTDGDWRALALDALSAMRLDVAKKGFIRVRDIRYLDLISRIEHQRKLPDFSEEIARAEILAYQGRFQDAAKIYVKHGKVEAAMDMFCDLRQWKEARRFADQVEGVDVRSLIRRHAEWAELAQDWKSAGELWYSCGDSKKAVTMLGAHQLYDELIDLGRRMAKDESAAISVAGSYFMEAGNVSYAKEMFLKVNNHKRLMDLYVSANLWEEAFLLLKQHPDLNQDLFLPYALWLAENDRFEEALDGFTKAGKLDEALRVLQMLAHNAVVESRFADGAYFFWRLSNLNLKFADSLHDREAIAQRVRLFHQYQEMAEVYYAYHHIYRYTEEPFTTLSSEALFNMARFLVIRTGKSVPFGVSRVRIFFTLAGQARAVGAFRLARSVYDRLRTLRIPDRWMTQIDTGMLTIKSKPFNDVEDLHPFCYRCSSPNPMLGASNSDGCTNCFHPYIRSFYSFEHLPLVEFVLDDTISHAEAMKILQRSQQKGRSSSSSKGGASGGANDGWRESMHGEANVMHFGGEQEDVSDVFGADDPFTQQLMNLSLSDGYKPVVVDRAILQSLTADSVFVRNWPSSHVPHTYFRSMIPEVAIVMCSGCQQFFHEGDYEFQILQKKCCPFCRTAVAVTDEIPSPPVSP